MLTLCVHPLRRWMQGHGVPRGLATGSPTSTAGCPGGVLGNITSESIIQPRYVGNAVALSETLTFTSLLFWAVILGPVGAILAVPLTLLARTILLDSDPAIAWWRPLTGDKKDLEGILKQEDDAIRTRRARRGTDNPGAGIPPKA